MLARNAKNPGQHLAAEMKPGKNCRRRLASSNQSIKHEKLEVFIY
jgi:hypothetical protein